MSINRIAPTESHKKTQTKPLKQPPKNPLKTKKQKQNPKPHKPKNKPKHQTFLLIGKKSTFADSLLPSQLDFSKTPLQVRPIFKLIVQLSISWLGSWAHLEVTRLVSTNCTLPQTELCKPKPQR